MKGNPSCNIGYNVDIFILRVERVWIRHPSIVSVILFYILHNYHLIHTSIFCSGLNKETRCTILTDYSGHFPGKGKGYVTEEYTY